MEKDLQYALDWIAIRQVSAQYNRYADEGDGEKYASLYTEDAEFDIVGNRVYRGRQEIAMAAMSTKVTVHITTDPIIEIDGDVAYQTSRLISGYRAPDQSANEFIATGMYIDELHRTDEGWRFYRRRCELDLETSEVMRKMGISEAFAAIKDA